MTWPLVIGPTTSNLPPHQIRSQAKSGMASRPGSQSNSAPPMPQIGGMPAIARSAPMCFAPRRHTETGRLRIQKKNEESVWHAARGTTDWVRAPHISDCRDRGFRAVTREDLLLAKMQTFPNSALGRLLPEPYRPKPDAGGVVPAGRRRASFRRGANVCSWRKTDPHSAEVLRTRMTSWRAMLEGCIVPDALSLTKTSLPLANGGPRRTRLLSTATLAQTVR